MEEDVRKEYVYIYVCVYIHTHVTESYYCTPETDTTL